MKTKIVKTVSVILGIILLCVYIGAFLGVFDLLMWGAPTIFFVFGLCFVFGLFLIVGGILYGNKNEPDEDEQKYKELEQKHAKLQEEYNKLAAICKGYAERSENNHKYGVDAWNKLSMLCMQLDSSWDTAVALTFLKKASAEKAEEIFKKMLERYKSKQVV